MPKTYYVDSVTGSDTNAGLSSDAPLASLVALEKIVLSPGDTVLFARGSTYNDQLDIKNSGSLANPISFGAYGDGDAPLIHGAGRGIYGSKADNIVVRDLAIADTSGNAIYAGGAKNWVVENVTVTGTGGPNAGSISFQSCSNITIRNCDIEDVFSDGIWMDKVTGVLIENNSIGTVQGHNGDNVQVVNSTDVVVRGNVLDMSEATNSSKGNLVVNKSQNVLIEGNTLTGGGFGASVNSDDVAIIGNEISGQSGYTWSFGIGLGEQWSVSNYLISNNFIHDVKLGISLTGFGEPVVHRTDIDITNNIFENTGAALKVDRPSSGEFSNNFISVGSNPVSISKSVAESGTFVIGENTTFVTTDPQANFDYAAIASDHELVSGNLTDNDSSMTGAQLWVRNVQGQDVDAEVHTVVGKYGTLTIDAAGSYSYVVDADKMAGIGETVQDVFTYLVTDTKNNAHSTLTITVEPRPNVGPDASHDFAITNGDGNVVGNLLANDTDADGNTLDLETVNGINLGEGMSKIEGKYGVLTISADGTYSYDLDGAKRATLSKDSVETFTITVGDGRDTDTSLLTIDLNKAAIPVLSPKLKPVAVDDRFYVDASGRIEGNILANDYDPNGTAVYLRTVGDFRVSDKPIVLFGTYGSLTISSSGAFVYEANAGAPSGLGAVKDSFRYKISDGSLQDAGAFSFYLEDIGV
jgi:polysaccharidase protein